MSITKNIFTVQDTITSITEVGEWLTKNSSLVGMTVTSGDDYVSCTSKEGTEFLKFTKPSSYDSIGTTITLANGEKVEQASNMEPTVFIRGYACSNGLAVVGENNDIYTVIFIGKTEKDSVCVIKSSFSELYYADIENGRKIFAASSMNSKDYVYLLNNGEASVRTSFAPLCFDSGDISNEIFVTPQTQFPATGSPNSEMILVVDGAEYVYDGYIAMKG